MTPKTLDHVAFWLADREPIAELLTTELPLHVIDRQDNFTLLGADARRGKLTLFDAEGPREQGAFKHVALRVSELPDGVTEFDLGEGLKLILVEAPTDSEYDLDHVALYSADPRETAEAYERFGFDAAPPSATRASRSAAPTSSSTRGTRATRTSRCSTTSPSSSTPSTSTSSRPRRWASSTTSSTPRTRARSSSGGRSAPGSSTSSTSRNS